MKTLNKKTLIISSYAPPSIGGAQIMTYNLFRDFQPDSYSILTSFYNINSFAAQNGRWLSGKYFFYDNPKAGKESYNKQDGGSAGKRSLFQSLKLAAKRLGFLKTVLSIPAVVGQIMMIVRSGPRAVKQNGSQAILVLSDYGPAMIGGYIVHKITKKPLVVFMFDLYKGNYLPFFGGFLSVIFEPLIFKSASRIIVNNDGTKDFYEKEYGGKINHKINIVYNATFPDSYKPAAEPAKTKTSFNIVFTGQIYWPQLGSIKNLIKAIREIDKPDITLEIYSPNPKDYLKKIGISEDSKIKISVAPPDKISAIQRTADILFLPLSWHTKGPQIIDTATPGKLTDYLLSGRPILIHAPASTYLVKYAGKNKFALVVDEENTNKLKEAVISLITDKKLEAELVKNARETFFRNHDVNKNAAALAGIINSVS